MGQDKKISMFALIEALFAAITVYEKTDGEGTFAAMSNARKAIWDATAQKRMDMGLEGTYHEVFGPRGHYSMQMEKAMEQAIERTLARCAEIRARILKACA